jgi:hypothetical protein
VRTCSDLLQRFCTTHKIRLVKLADLFVTRLSIAQVGGIPGLFLTLADIGSVADPITVYGPTGITDIVTATRLFASHATAVLHVIASVGLPLFPTLRRRMKSILKTSFVSAMLML